jgi:hypothetical protein
MLYNLFQKINNQAGKALEEYVLKYGHMEDGVLVEPINVRNVSGDDPCVEYWFDGCPKLIIRIKLEESTDEINES